MFILKIKNQIILQEILINHSKPNIIDLSTLIYTRLYYK